MKLGRVAELEYKVKQLKQAAARARKVLCTSPGCEARRLSTAPAEDWAA